MATKYFKKDIFKEISIEKGVDVRKELSLELNLDENTYAYHYFKIIHYKKSPYCCENVLFGGKMVITSVPQISNNHQGISSFIDFSVEDFIEDIANNALHDSICEITKEEYFEGISGFEDHDVEDPNEGGEFSFDLYQNEFPLKKS